MSDQVNHQAKIVSTAEFKQLLQAAARPMLVDFYADWCGPCQMAAPVLEELAKQYAGQLDIVKVNVDNDGALAQEYNVSGIPTVIGFKQTQSGFGLAETKTGYAGKTGYEQMIKSLLQK